MILEELIIKNFRSFGNNENVLSFNTVDGELILIVGKNGSGKTSLINSIDYNLYKKANGQTKPLKISSLPNRYNKNLLTKLKFNKFNKDYKIIRGTYPDIFDIYINNVKQYENASAELKQSKIDEILDFSYNSWKSYISLNINDFKNFMSLNPDDKKLLIDKLFNLELLNTITSHIKEYKKQEEITINILKTEIDSTINTIKKLNNSLSSDDLKTEILSKKHIYESLKNRVDEHNKVYNDFVNKKNELTNQYSQYNYELNDINKKLKVFDNNICPLCHQEINQATIISYKDELIENRNNINILIDNINNDIKTINDNINKINITKLNKEFNDIRVELTILKNKYNESLNDNSNISQIENMLNDKKEKYNKHIEYDNILNDTINIINKPIIKQRIITSVLTPINKFISEILDEIDFEYNVEMDKNFNVVITNNRDIIDENILSNGETRKVNIAIMIAYLKMIRTNVNINIMFLDEIFTSIDIDGINDILIQLRKFAKDYKINIFLIQHTVFEPDYFDRIIKIEKDITSNINY